MFEAAAKATGKSLANEVQRGKTSPDSTPGSFAPAGGGVGMSEKAKSKAEMRQRRF